MKFSKNNKKWFVAALIAIAFVPIIITALEVVFTNTNSVVFLGNYNPKVGILVISYYIFLLVLGVFWIINQLVAVNRLKNEQAKAELMLLKSQVNPHFFFNMLNNLYGLVAIDAGKARELILKLSDMMRYSIYEGEKGAVTLKEEISYLKNYLELHKMRYHKRIDIDLTCDIDEEIKVTPLLFIILLENAFKHGVENLRDNAYVNVSIRSFQQSIQFSVENNFDSSDNKMNVPGIGLENLKRRLELTYPGKHKLLLSVTENVYKALLILNYV